MTEHLKAERDLVDSMFVSKDATRAHELNLQSVTLLQRREALIGTMKFHDVHEHAGSTQLEFALP